MAVSSACVSRSKTPRGMAEEKEVDMLPMLPPPPGVGLSADFHEACRTLPEKFSRDRGHVLALETRALELDAGRLAAAVVVGDGRGAVGGIAHDFLHPVLSLEG